MIHEAEKLYQDVSFSIAGLMSKTYSTSFSMASRLLDPEQRKAIYGIYGFVRLADEIVDTFHHSDQPNLLNRFESELNEALRYRISLNPVLNAFQATVHRYGIDEELITAFLHSMRLDLTKKDYETIEEMNRYIYGSADVVGLMCLKVFSNGEESLYTRLKEPAMRLGSAFQKVNFLRDLHNDTQILQRRYFPALTTRRFTDQMKADIIRDIESDFSVAYAGIRQLPGRARLAVLAAYYYYRALLRKLKKTPACLIQEKRLRISNGYKMVLLAKAYLMYRWIPQG